LFRGPFFSGHGVVGFYRKGPRDYGRKGKRKGRNFKEECKGKGWEEGAERVKGFAPYL